MRILSVVLCLEIRPIYLLRFCLVLFFPFFCFYVDDCGARKVLSAHFDNIFAPFCYTVGCLATASDCALPEF